MTLLAQSKALIINLRSNGGGDSGMDMLMAAYLLDQPAEMSPIYDRPSNRLTRATSPMWAPGHRFGGTKPVYVSTGGGVPTHASPRSDPPDSLL